MASLNFSKEEKRPLDKYLKSSHSRKFLSLCFRNQANHLCSALLHHQVVGVNFTSCEDPSSGWWGQNSPESQAASKPEAPSLSRWRFVE